MKCEILIPVWHGYQWMAPLTWELLQRHWPAHPPISFVGLSGGERDLPALPVSSQTERGNWTAVLREGVRQVREKGVDYVYLIAEEHVPLASCHERHLNETLPRLMEEMPAVYISLMGWDNRRYTSKSPVLGPERFRMKHLAGDRDPRFHLHPALWRTEALEACCDLALRDAGKNGSAWHFEKANDRMENALPESWKHQCYQICAEAMSVRAPSRAQHVAGALERTVFHKLMALYPLIPSRSLANRYARAAGFDDFFCDGPYPMFYSGVMAKGRINPYLEKFLGRRDPSLLERIVTALGSARS